VLRIRDVMSDPYFFPSRTRDLVSRIQQQKEEGGQFVALPFFEAINLSELKIILFLKRYR
jgi:hypothetical protein